MSLSFEQLRQKNEERNAESFQPCAEWTPLEWCGAMCGEAGEAANKAKKLRRGEPIPATAIAMEAADAVIYADLLCSAIGMTLEEALFLSFNTKSEVIGSSVMLRAEAGQ